MQPIQWKYIYIEECVLYALGFIKKYRFLLHFIIYLILYCFQLQLQKTQYLQLGPNRGLYYGGSLPNVNQIGNGTIDVAFQVRHLFYVIVFTAQED